MPIARLSMQESLRWLRRATVVILIVSNLVTVILVDAAAGQPELRSSSTTLAALYAPGSVENPAIEAEMMDQQTFITKGLQVR